MADTDLLIVGAGLAGLPIAIACASAGWQVTLLDRNAKVEPIPTDPLHAPQRGFFGAVRLRAQELDVAALGYVVENRQWVASLMQAVMAHPSIKVKSGAAIESVSVNHDECVTATLNTSETISARLLIASDGVNSRVRDLVGIGDKHVDYEQSALLTTIRTSEPHHGCAFERFTSQGPLALLPRPNNTMSVVWCLDSNHSEPVKALDNNEILNQLQSLNSS